MSKHPIERLTRNSICMRCKRRPVEVIEGYGDIETYISPQCGSCNDGDIERNRERDEWNHFHPNHKR